MNENSGKLPVTGCAYCQFTGYIQGWGGMVPCMCTKDPVNTPASTPADAPTHRTDAELISDGQRMRQQAAKVVADMKAGADATGDAGEVERLKARIKELEEVTADEFIPSTVKCGTCQEGILVNFHTRRMRCLKCNEERWTNGRYIGKIDPENDELRSTIATLRAECAGLREDKRRLDWLEKTPVGIGVPFLGEPNFHIFSDEGDGEGPTLRAAIDAASRAGTEGRA